MNSHLPSWLADVRLLFGACIVGYAYVLFAGYLAMLVDFGLAGSPFVISLVSVAIGYLTARATE